MPVRSDWAVSRKELINDNYFCRTEDAADNNWYERHPVIPNSAYGSEADEWRKKYIYDSDQFGSGTTYPKGRLTKVEGNYDTDSTVEYYEYYQYSREGWITKQRQYIAGAISRDIEYEYDTRGRLQKVIFADAQNSEEFFIWYDYDSAGRLYKIYSHTSNSKPGTATAEYAYNARGQITQEKLGGTVQQVDFTYNARGFLTKINDPGSLGSDRFAMQFAYDDSITGAPSPGGVVFKNGNVTQIEWVNVKWDTTSYYYTFEYDSRDQLTKADCSDNDYDVSSFSYDNNGNISGLNRGTAWTYYYDGDENNTNRLDNISGLTSDDNWDYDSNGRQTKDTNGSFSSCTYHFPGAAFHNITMSSGTLQMRYNASNRRLQKIVVSGITTNYVRDISGQVLAVYEGADIKERYVWGPLGLVSIVKGNNTSPTRYYTVTDHLGSVHSVVNTSGTAVAGYDYYPYGETLRSSVSPGADSRFMFQGKEFDNAINGPSLDLYYFEARFYRPDVGRFVSPDPIRKGWSYYAYANNNPIRFTDPMGLSADDPFDPTGPIAREHIIHKGDFGYDTYEFARFPGSNTSYIYSDPNRAAAFEAAMQQGITLLAQVRYWNAWTNGLSEYEIDKINWQGFYCIVEESINQGVDPALALSIANIEYRNFDPNPWKVGNDYGYFQLNIVAHRERAIELGVPFMPLEAFLTKAGNIYYGVGLLRNTWRNFVTNGGLIAYETTHDRMQALYAMWNSGAPGGYNIIEDWLTSSKYAIQRNNFRLAWPQLSRFLFNIGWNP